MNVNMDLISRRLIATLPCEISSYLLDCWVALGYLDSEDVLTILKDKWPEAVLKTDVTNPTTSNVAHAIWQNIVLVC